MNYSLYELYKSPEVNRISTFGDVAAQISPRDIEAAYAEARDVAPRRHDHNKKYFVEHAGLGNRSDNSNRKEEHLALALYSAIVEANTAELATEASDRFDRSIDVAPPALVVMAPEDYWAGYFAHPSAGKWWPTLSTLAKETDERLNVETHFLGLRNIDIRMGGKGRPPELIGNHSVFDIAELARG